MSSQTHRFAPARWQSLRLPFGLTATGLGLAGIVVLAAGRAAGILGVAAAQRSPATRTTALI